MSVPETLSSNLEGGWQDAFLHMLPAIEARLRRQFRRLSPEAADEAVQEGVASAVQAFARLYGQGRAEVAHPVGLVRYAARHVRAGRRVGGTLNIADPLSPYAQRRKGIHVQQLDQHCRDSGKLIEAAIADRRTPIPERVALRIDMPQWLMGLSRRLRRIAKDLAIGCTTSEVAQEHGLSAGRISQIRRELYCSWERFHWDEASGA